MPPTRRKPWMLIAVVLVLAGFAVCIVEIVLTTRAGSRLDRLRAAVVAENGGSLDPFDHLPPPVPGEQDALPEILEAATLAKEAAGADQAEALRDAISSYRNDPEKCTPEELAILDRAGANLDSLLAKLEETSPRARFQSLKREDGDLFAIEIPYDEMKTISRLLVIDGRRALERGDLERALRDLEAACGILESFKDWPMIFMILVQASMMKEIADLSEKILAATDLNASHLERLRLALARTEGGANLRDALELERLAGMRFFETGSASFGWGPPQPGGEATWREYGFLLWQSSHFWREDYATMLEYYERVMLWLDRPLWTRLQEDVEKTPQSLSTYFSSMLQMNLSSIEKNIAKADARRRMLVLASILVQDKLDGQNYPETLDGIPGDWIDPFTGKSFDYTRSSNGFTLRSPGGDGVYDTQPLEPNDTGNDILFTISR